MLMYSSFIPPRQIKIGDAAAFVGTTPRAIRHYHEIGLVPEPVRGGDDRRRYGYEDMIRLLWIRKMADAGVALDDIRDAFADTPSAGADSDDGIAGILERLEETLLAQEAELRRQRTAVQRMRTEGSRMGLLSGVVTSRLKSLPEGSLRQADLDSLLVTERIFGPLGAAVQATRFIALATHPALREESDRVDAAEEALDDTVAVDRDPAWPGWLPNAMPSKWRCKPPSRIPVWRRATTYFSTPGTFPTPPSLMRAQPAKALAGTRNHERIRSYREDALRLLPGPPALHGAGRRTRRPPDNRFLKDGLRIIPA